MSTISSISRLLLALGLALWPAAGLGGCTPAADVPAPDIDACPARHYRITSVEIPIRAVDAITLGFDLDDDGVRDNWLGFANAVLHAWSPAFEVAPVIEARLERELDWRLAVHQCSAGGPASAATGDGDAAPDVTEGDGVITASGGRMPGGSPLTGGTFAIPLGALSDALGDAGAGWVTAPLAQIRFDAIDSRTARATIGLAVTADDVATIVAPRLAAYFTARLAADDSDFARDADRDGDRIVTAAELLASDTAQLLLAPDLADQPALAGEGASLGFAIRAVRLDDE